MKTNKELIPGFVLNIHDFSGDLENVIGRLNDTVARLKDEYSDLELIAIDNELHLYGVKR